MRENILRIKENMKKVIIGKDEVMDRILTALLSGGHVLLEDLPGTGKTVLAKSLAKSMNGEFRRVQFTPDLLPSDVTGLHYFNQKEGEFQFREGPVFTQILLADEINRTSPKTQSALLESMEEKNVTVDGVTHPLPSPFICIATQNPLGASGTHPLPESQLDRFMIQLSIGYPSCEDQIKILNARRYTNPLHEIKPVCDAKSLMQVQDYLSAIKVTEDIMRYAIRLCEETRVHPFVELGISPRGVIALIRMAKANALVEQRNYVVPEDVQSVYLDVCVHRLVLRPQALIEGVNKVQILQGILEKVKPPVTIGGKLS